jgi:hypothetical protein
LEQRGSLHSSRSSFSTYKKLTQLCVFEESVVEYEGGFFRPLEEAVDRWDRVYRAAYEICGHHLELIYELKNGCFVFVRYFNCRRIRDDAKKPPAEMWYSSKQPEAFKISELEVVRFLLDAQLPVPRKLDNALRELRGIPSPPPPPPTPKEAAPLRPWTTWTVSEYVGLLHKGPAHKVDVIEELRVLINWIIKGVQALRDDSPVANLSIQATVRFFLCFLFKRYPVDPNHWWGPEAIPPSEVDLLQLRWPEKTFRAHAALKAIRSLLDGPLAVKYYPPSTSDPLYPTWEEQLAAEEAVTAAIPEVERQLAIIKEVYAAAAAEKEQAQRAAEEAAGVETPTTQEFQIWKFLQESGLKQDAAAKEIERRTGEPCNQTKVSRSKKKVARWLESGNKFPEMAPLPNPKVRPVDPSQLELGKSGQKQKDSERPDLNLE